MIYAPSRNEGYLLPGEILSNLLILEMEIRDGQQIGYSTSLPLCVVLSQWCDLEQEYSVRTNGPIKEADHWQIPNILVCEVHTEDRIKVGQGLNSDLMRRVRENANERYQYLRAVQPTGLSH